MSTRDHIMAELERLYERMARIRTAQDLTSKAIARANERLHGVPTVPVEIGRKYATKDGTIVVAHRRQYESMFSFLPGEKGCIQATIVSSRGTSDSSGDRIEYYPDGRCMSEWRSNLDAFEDLGPAQ